MKIIDRTIIGNFMVNLILWCLVLCGIIVISDLLTHFDDFFNPNVERNPFGAIIRYYGFFCARIADAFLTFLILISALNIVINMIRRNEVIALMSIGVSPTRILLPVLGASLLLSGVSFYLREIFVPNHIVSVTGGREFFTMKAETVPVKPVLDEWTRVTVEGESVSIKGDRIHRPVFKLPSAFISEGREIRAAEAVYSQKNAGRPEGYLLRNVENADGFLTKGSIDVNGIVRGEQGAEGGGTAEITDTAPTAAPSDDQVADSKEGPTDDAGKLIFDEKNILVYTPADDPNLAPEECFIVCGIPPEYLAVGQEWKSFTSTPKLIGAVKNASLPFKTNDLLLRIHSRILKPLSDLFPLLLGLPILFVYKDGNPYKRGIAAALAAGLYIGAGYAALFLLPGAAAPVLRVWFPMILFFPVVILLFHELKNC